MNKGNYHDPGYPPGMQKFMDDLESKVRNKGTEAACMDCEKCGKEIKLAGEMNVFVYPDDPYFTTKALCIKCLVEEKINQSADSN